MEQQQQQYFHLRILLMSCKFLKTEEGTIMAIHQMHLYGFLRFFN